MLHMQSIVVERISNKKEASRVLYERSSLERLEIGVNTMSDYYIPCHANSSIGALF